MRTGLIDRMPGGGEGRSAPGGVSAPRGVSALGGCAPGGCARGGGCVGIPACTEADTPPPVDRITDACKNITLTQFRCGR